MPMSACTTFRVGGPADCLVDITSVAELQTMLAFVHRHSLPFVVIGNGSNLLVRDGGIRGMVIRLSSLFSEVAESARVTLSDTVPGDGDALAGAYIHADAGISLSALAQYAAVHGLAGLAPLSGIPGTLGGAILMNAGAYGGEIGPLLSEVSGVSTDSGEVISFPGHLLTFSYRTSPFMSMPMIITSATLFLKTGDPEAIRAEMQALSVQRREKQPLTLPSAGSTFKRPQGAFAAKLIDECGLRGFTIGQAQVSEKHCGFIVNLGNATAAEILTLMDYVRNTVYVRTGYTLEPEVRIIGENEKHPGGNTP
ncbi:MAG: UDP-N-acetylmuramate dehydrogenase [Clostridia bacterium]|nr:UDP-N-acetylmuramate dehydrogenase [Clostridia bacterium]